MLLNPLSLNFVIWLPANFFYNEVVKLWKPTFKRMYLPYVTIEDLFNSQITSVSFPNILNGVINLMNLNYQISKRNGKQIDLQMQKSVSLTIKLSDSYMTYFIARQLTELFMKWGDKYQNLYLPPINVTILDDGGFENITYTYYQITPTSLSDFDLSYSARPGTFNTFTWGFNYNYFDIWYRDELGNRVKYDLDIENGMLHDPGAPDISKNMSAINAKRNKERIDNVILVKSMLK